MGKLPGENSVFSQGLQLVSCQKDFAYLVLIQDLVVFRAQPNPRGQVRKYPNLKTSDVHHLIMDSLRVHEHEAEEI